MRESLLRSWRNREVLDPTGGSGRGWLFPVAKRIAIHQRRSASRQPLVLTDHVPERAVGDTARRAVDRQLVHAALRTLSIEHRQTLFETYFRGPSVSHAADPFLARLDERTEDRDLAVSNETIGVQLSALAKWELGTSPAGLTNVVQPVLVVNGDNDTMLPTIGSFHLAQQLPDAQPSIYPDSGHGGIFQHHNLFVRQVLDFLRN